MKTLLRRLRYLFRQRQIEAEIAEEIEAHRLMAEARERNGGRPPHDAAAASHRAMGNITLAREEARAAWISPWLESAWQDVLYALRMFRRAPAFTATLVLVLGIGIGATTAVFTLVDGLILRPLPVQSPDRLVYFSSPSFSYPIFSEVRARSTDVIESVAAWSVEDMHVAWGQELEPADVLTASGGFHATLGVAAAMGRTFSEDDDQIGGGPHGRVAVISDAAWRRRYGGDPGAIGRTVRVGPDPFTIVGVTPRGYSGVTPGMAPELTIPLLSTVRPAQLKSPTSSWVHLIARLRDGVTLREANTSLARFWPEVLEATTPSSVEADRRAHFLGRKTSLESASAGFSRVRNRFAEPLWFLFALVGVLLMVACASAANLLLARGAGRRREIAVRLAIGAGRTRLVRQMLTESLVWTLLASLAGLLIASWGANALVALMTTREQKIDLDAGLSIRVMLFALAVAAVTSAICSVLPAVGATRIDPAAGLRAAPDSSRAIPSRWASGRWIVAAQVALSVLLLGSAALFGRSLYSVLTQSAGVDRQNVLVLATDVDATGYDEERAARFYQELLDRVRRVPGVAAASLSMYPPISGGDGAWTENVGIDGAPPRPGSITVYFNTVSSNYFGTTGMTLLRGRDVADGDQRVRPPGGCRQRDAGAPFLPRAGSAGPPDHHRPGQVTKGSSDHRPGFRRKVSAAPGNAARGRVPALAAAAGRQHVHRDAGDAAGIGVGAGPPRGARPRPGRSDPGADCCRPHPRIDRHRARAGLARGPARCGRCGAGLCRTLRAARVRCLQEDPGNRCAPGAWRRTPRGRPAGPVGVRGARADRHRGRRCRHGWRWDGSHAVCCSRSLPPIPPLSPSPRRSCWSSPAWLVSAPRGAPRGSIRSLR